MPKTCPVCNRPVVLWGGKKDALFYMIGDVPDEEDYQLGMPFVGRNGKIMRGELARQGMDLNQFRFGNLRVHPQHKDKDAECFSVSTAKAVRELSKATAVLLIGGEVTRFFTGHSIDDVAGLRVEDQVSLFTAKLVIPVPMITLIFTNGFGEIRLALKRFSTYAEELGLL